MPGVIKVLTAKDVKLYRPNEGHDGSKFHESDFLDGVIEGRTAVASTCEMGHRTISIAHIANICARMQLKSLKWDPKTETFGSVGLMGEKFLPNTAMYRRTDGTFMIGGRRWVGKGPLNRPTLAVSETKDPSGKWLQK